MYTYILGISPLLVVYIYFTKLYHKRTVRYSFDFCLERRDTDRRWSRGVLEPLYIYLDIDIDILRKYIHILRVYIIFRGMHFSLETVLPLQVFYL